MFDEHVQQITLSYRVTTCLLVHFQVTCKLHSPSFPNKLHIFEMSKPIVRFIKTNLGVPRLMTCFISILTSSANVFKFNFTTSNCNLLSNIYWTNSQHWRISSIHKSLLNPFFVLNFQEICYASFHFYSIWPESLNMEYTCWKVGQFSLISFYKIQFKTILI